MDRFYQKILMDHFKNPRNKHVVENHNFDSGENNPSCGDSVSITGRIENGTIQELGFQGSGCVISMASASMLTDKCKGMTVDEVLALTKEDILKMIGMTLGPNRLHCALLPLEALRKALADKEKKD